MECYQLDFWKGEEESEIDALRKEIVAIRESSNKVRKKCFSEIGKYAKIVADQEIRLNILEHHLCRNIPLNLTLSAKDSEGSLFSKEKI